MSHYILKSQRYTEMALVSFAKAHELINYAMSAINEPSAKCALMIPREYINAASACAQQLYGASSITSVPKRPNDWMDCLMEARLKIEAALLGLNKDLSVDLGKSLTPEESWSLLEQASGMSTHALKAIRHIDGIAKWLMKEGIE